MSSNHPLRCFIIIVGVIVAFIQNQIMKCSIRKILWLADSNKILYFNFISIQVFQFD